MASTSKNRRPSARVTTTTVAVSGGIMACSSKATGNELVGESSCRRICCSLARNPLASRLRAGGRCLECVRWLCGDARPFGGWAGGVSGRRSANGSATFRIRWKRKPALGSAGEFGLGGAPPGIGSTKASRKLATEVTRPLRSNARGGSAGGGSVAADR